jgi:hypothetical protein
VLLRKLFFILLRKPLKMIFSLFLWELLIMIVRSRAPIHTSYNKLREKFTKEDKLPAHTWMRNHWIKEVLY